MLPMGVPSAVPALAKKIFELAERGLHFIGHARHVGHGADIGLDGDSVAAQRRLGLVELGGVGAGDGDPGAMLLEQFGGGQPNAARTSGDQSGLSFQNSWRFLPGDDCG